LVLLPPHDITVFPRMTAFSIL